MLQHFTAAAERASLLNSAFAERTSSLLNSSFAERTSSLLNSSFAERAFSLLHLEPKSIIGLFVGNNREGHWHWNIIGGGKKVISSGLYKGMYLCSGCI